MSGPVRILVVDDDPADIELLRDHMDDADFSFTLSEAHDGVEALEALDASKDSLPQLILMDINMPRMDGLEALQAIRAKPEYDDVKIIMLTTSARDADIEQTFGHKGNYFITKPAEPEEFDEVIGILRDFSAAYIS